MSYSEKDGQVTLTMSRDEFDRLVTVFSIATSSILNGRGLITMNQVLELLNSLNAGNLSYKPYKLPPARPLGTPQSDDLALPGSPASLK